MRERGWADLVTVHESKRGERVEMPEWVLDHACSRVDATDAAAIVEISPDEWCVCNAYLIDDTIDSGPRSRADAIKIADSYNEARGVVPLVVPAAWAVLREVADGTE
jgi:hypothetical protein